MLELVSEAWDEIAKQYAVGTSITILAKNFNVSRARIKRRADRFAWDRDRKDKGDAATQAQTQWNHPSPSQEASEPAAARSANPRTVLIERHRAMG
jgi:hypothetical protein